MTERRQSRDDDLNQEIQVHLELEAESQRARGFTTAASERAARRAFGGILLTKEDVRAMWRGAWMEHWWQDARFGMRTLRKTPGFTAVALLTLGLGIGANTAIFSVVDAVILRPLAYSHPEELVAIQESVSTPSGTSIAPVNVAHFLDWRATTHAFQGMALLEGGQVNLTGGGDPESVAIGRVSASLFSVLGIQPRIGRTFADAEDQLGRDHVVILSDPFWRRRFQADPGVLGRTVQLNDEPYEVIGVLPPSFHFPKIGQLYGMAISADEPEVWKPLAAREAELDPGGEFDFACIARLDHGVSLAQGLADLQAAQARFVETLPNRPPIGVTVVPLHDQITGRSAEGLELLLAAVGTVLLIGCVNITNLLFARMSARRRELTLRSALGASRRRLVQQMLVESLVLSGAGGMLAAALAYGGVPLLLAAAPGDLPRLDEVHLDARMLVFTAMLSVATGLLVAAVPVWRLTRSDPRDAMQGTSTRSTAGRATTAFRSALVALEVALTVICLIAGGLLLRSFVNVLATDRGFDVHRVLSIDLNLPDNRYPTADARTAFARSVLDDVGELPGISATSVSNRLPLTGEGGKGIVSIEGVTVPPVQRPLVDYRIVNTGYFPTFAIPTVAGRLFADTDHDHAVAVISSLAAARIWPGESAIGKRFHSAPRNTVWIEVIGIVADVRSDNLEKAPTLTVYLPYWQATPPRIPPTVSFAFRVEREPRAVAGAIRAAIQRHDSEIPIAAFRTMDDVLDASVAQRRFQMELVLLFAVTAALLASLGVYGVVSYSVAQRRTEIGIRMALGATPAQIRGLVLRQGLLPIGAGLLVGLAVALLFDRVLRGLLYGVHTTDPLTLSGVALVVCTVAVAANYLPTRRATRIDPLDALRVD
jgi:predicted permease